MENEEYASDSEQSDDDFCPDNVDSDVSEEESESDGQSDSEENKSQKNVNKITKNSNKISKVTKSQLTERSTRTTIVCKENTATEKDNLESDEDDKVRTDALWSDFLSDTIATTKNVPKKSEIVASKSNSNETVKKSKTVPCEGNLKKITEILEFAGEEIKVEKVIPIDNNKSKNIDDSKSTSTKELPKFFKGPMKRPAVGGSGLGAILGQIGKKTKISVLEKSKLDWDGFKKNEGLTEELQTFNKGKDGYLERQDFLQRTDLRQFEIEKSLRQNKRNN